MINKKKEYLKSYLLQEKKIERYEKLASRCPREENNYRKYIEKSKKLRNEIEEKISLLEDDLLSELLFEKYIFGKTLEEIALILNYSKRHIERLHIKALEKFRL